MKEDTIIGINNYYKQLSDEDIKNNKHRNYVGGFWEEIGLLQFEFLKNHGLNQESSLLDIGCGPLRGGIHFIHYLNTSNYTGIDINNSMLNAGHSEIQKHSLSDKNPQLIYDDAFNFKLANKTFDFALSISVFTHLPINMIVRCLVNLKLVLNKRGKCFATFFQAPNSAYLKPIEQLKNIITHYDKDPFHYSFDEITYMARLADLHVEYIGDWNHPREQMMVVFENK
jgi:ubiquinone/menaquinone biosynthesis C-methylase UbiE